jgi:hypothetical protein
MYISGKPGQALAASCLILLALLSGHVLIVVLGLATAIMWGVRVAGEYYAHRQLEGFLDLCKATKP